MATNQSLDPSQWDPATAATLMQLFNQKGNDTPPVAAPAPSPSSVQPTSTMSYIRPEIPGAGLGSWLSKLATGKPLMHPGDPIQVYSNPPSREAAKNLGLPDIPQVGTDANGNPLFSKEDVENQYKNIYLSGLTRAKANIANPTFSKDELVAQGMDPDQADSLSKLYPNGLVPQKAVSNTSSFQKNNTGQAMVDARNRMVDVMGQRLQAQTLGPQARQQSMQDAQGRQNNIERYYGIYDRIAQNGFQATKLERTLANTEVARVIAGSGGVMTDDGFNRVAQDSGMQTGGNWASWLTNTATPVEFKSFLDNSKGLMDNEYVINAGLFRKAQLDNARDLNLKAPQASNPPNLLPNVTKPALPQGMGFDNAGGTPPSKPVDTTGRITMRKPDGSVVAVAAKDVIRARAKGYQVQ